MIKNQQILKNKVHKLLKTSSNRELEVYYRNYFMGRFLARLANSKYKENFIIKGGTLLSQLFGISKRGTMDIDSTIRNLLVEVDNITNILNEIFTINLKDGVTFKIISVSQIMKIRDYPGLGFTIQGSLDRIKQNFSFDFSFGDVITPSPIKTDFNLLFSEETVNLWTYNIETVLAEKLHSILTKDKNNTRMRDFYDLVMIKETQKVSWDNFNKSVNATFRERDNLQYLENYKVIFNIIKNSLELENRWNNFVKDSYFIDELPWKTVLDNLEYFLNKLFKK